jgi:hypothetical protein
MGLRRIPTLAKNARVGQPQQKVGQPRSPRFWHIYSRFFRAVRRLECTMSKLMGRTGGTGIQGRAMDMVFQVRRTQAS